MLIERPGKVLFGPRIQKVRGKDVFEEGQGGQTCQLKDRGDRHVSSKKDRGTDVSSVEGLGGQTGRWVSLGNKDIVMKTTRL